MRPLVPFLVLVVTACATTPPPPPPRYTPTFAYTPKKLGAGAGVSIAIVRPKSSDRLAAVSAQGEADYMSAMREALGRSVLQYFTSNEFTVSGPFAKVDEMSFPEKKQADLLLVIEIDLMPAFPMVVGSARNSVTSGSCSVGGAISFVLWEPLSMQRMWSKSVDVTKSRDCSTTGSWAYVQQDLVNGMARLYESAFPEVMRAAEKYFHPDEVQVVKKQSLELREKKVF